MATSLINTNNTSIYTPQYTLVSNVSTLNSALQGLFQAEVLAIDCETTGLDPLTDSIRLIQIAALNHPVLLIDLPAIPKSDRQLLKKLLCNSAVKIAHNAKFDWQFLTLAGLQPFGQFFDTQLAYKVLTAGLKTSSSLQNIVKKLLHLQLDKTQQISDWCKPLKSVQLHYAAVDAAILLDLYPILLNKLKQAKLLKIARLEFQCMPVVAQMELNGMLFDLSRWQILGAKLEAEKTDALNQLKQLRIASSQMSLLPELTDAVNPNSPQQVLAALQAIGIKINSTNQSKLVSLAAQYPIIQALLSYRRLSKIIGTFTEKLPQHIHPKTGRIHPNYYQLVAREIHLISLYSHWEFGMKPEEFYAKWDVSYEQIALICCCSDSTVRGWFKQGKFRRYPQPNDLRHLAFMDFLLEHFEEVPEQLWQLLCLTHSP